MTETVQTSAGTPETAGILTFLIADIRGYTRFTVEHGDAAAAELSIRFADLVRDVTRAHDGKEIELRGDEALCVFASARQALRCSVAIQDRLTAETRENLPLRAGVGLDAGEAIPVADGFRGAALNLAARLCSLAGPGEVLASETVVNLARRIEGLEYVERGYSELKGFSAPVKVMAVVGPTSSALPDGSDVARASVPDLPAGADPGSFILTDDLADQRFPIGAFLGALPDGALVARGDERRRVEAIIDTVSSGEGRCLLIGGEAGVGKTRLAQEVTLLARNHGFTVLTGRCYQPYSAVPFYPFREALAQAHELPGRALRTQLARRWPYLARLLPDVSIPSPPPAANSHEEQQRLFWAVTGVLEALTGHQESAHGPAARPLALLLDDLQWADTSSLELLQHLARLTRGYPILLLGTYRETEGGPRHGGPLQRVIADLDRERLVERIVLNRMDREGTAEFMVASIGNSDISRRVVDLIHARTEGNPFFTYEVLRALVDRGEIYHDSTGWACREGVEIEVPDTVRVTIDQRLTSLGEQAQEALTAASILGQTFLFDDLQAVLGWPEDDLERALDEGLGSGLLRAGSGDEYSFNHALTHQALTGELPPRRLRRLHLAAGQALERLPRPVRERRATELAQHFLRGGEPERGLPYAILAGDAAEAVFAHADAAIHYGTALELAQQIGDAGQEARVREKLGGLLTATIQYAAALAMLEESARLYRSEGDWESEGRVVAQIGRVHVVNGTVAEGLARLSAFRPALQERGLSPALANLVSALAHLLFAMGRFEEAQSAAEEARDLARRVGDAAVLAEAEARRGATLGMLGQLDGAEDALRSALAFAETARDVFTRCRALQALAGIALLRRDVARSHEELEHALRLADHMGNRRQVAVSNFGLSLQALVAGDADASSLHAERALLIMRALEGSWATACQIPGLDPASLPAEVWNRAGHYLRECAGLLSRTTDD
jgi:class 3 adenylate cyclase/tetratricopeptide (TPR) repeat protein